MREQNLKQCYLASAVSACLLVSTQSQADLTIEEVIVTAQKREQSLQDVPISVEVISADTLSRRAITDTRSLAQAAPSLNFQDGFGPVATNFNIRGLASYTIEGGLQPSVSLVVDGVPVARNGEFITELADIERVEVLRGPQGTLFGRNSTGGAINIVTKRPSDETEGYIDISATTDSEQLYRASISGELSEGVRGSLLGFYKDRDGHIENIFPGSTDLGGEEVSGGRAKLDVDFTSSLNVLFTLDYLNSTHGFSPQVVNTPEDLGVLAGGTFLRTALQGDGDLALGQSIMNAPTKVNIDDDLNSDNETDSYGLSADLTWELSDDVTLRAISAYREWDAVVTVDVDSGPGRSSNRNDFVLLPVDVRTNLNRNNPSSKHTNLIEYSYFSQEIRLEGASDSMEWIAGVYYQDFEEAQGADVDLYLPASFPGGMDLDPTNDSGVLLQSSQNVAATEAYAIFADLTFHLTESIDVFGGFRWTEEEVAVDYDQQLILSADQVDGFFLGANTYDHATNTAIIDLNNPGAAVIQTALGEDKADNGDWSGRLGISWQVTSDINLYASAARSFIGYGTNLGRAGAPGPNAFVEPTTAENFEIGIKSRLAENVQLNAAIFSMEATDLQTTLLLPGLITVPVNAGDLDIQGLEADVIWSLNEYARLTVGLAYTDAKVEDLMQACYPGQTVALGCIGGETDPAMGDLVGSGGLTDVSGSDAPNTPEIKYNIALDFDIPLFDLPFDGFGNITYTWQDDVHFTLNDDPLLVQEDYGILDIALGIADKDGRYELSLFGKNVGDEQFVGAMRESVGSIGRAFHRQPRGAEAYYGARLKINF